MKKNNNTILITTGIFPPDIGGPASYVPKIARRFLKDKITPIIITYSDVQFDVKYDNMGFRVIRIMRSRFFIIHYVKYFFAVLKHGRSCDLVFLQSYFSGGIPTLLANTFLRKKIIVKVVGIVSWERGMNRGKVKQPLYEYVIKSKKIITILEKKLINLCKIVIVPSNYMKNVLSKWGIKNSKIKTVYNSFDQYKFKKINKEEFKKSLGIKREKVYISIGRLVKRKNIDKLIHSFQNVSNSKLLIIGNGPEKNYLEKLVKDTKQENKIQFIGSCTKDEVYNYFQIADAYVILSSYEGMSHSLIEAISMNKYIIASDIEPNIETLEGYTNHKITNIESIDLNFKYSGDKDSHKVLEKFDFEILYLQLKKVLGI